MKPIYILKQKNDYVFSFRQCTLLLTAFFLSITSTAQYILQSSDVTIDANGYITECNVSDFNNPGSQNGNIEIPEQIGTLQIKGIGNGHPVSGGVFENKGISSVILPGSLIQIGNQAFYNNALSAVDIPQGVEIINPYAFKNNNISRVSIANSVTQILRQAFNNNAINTINGKSSDGIVYGRTANGIDSATIVSYGGTATHINFIPNSVTAIGMGAFSGSKLTSLDLPTRVTSIETGAFDGNPGLKVILPVVQFQGFRGWKDNNGTRYSGDDTIPDFTLAYTALLEYTLVDSNVTINNGSIINCSHIIGSHIIIPATLQSQTITSIAPGVFQSMSIDSITLPSPNLPGFTGWLDGNGSTHPGGSTLAYISTSYTAQYLKSSPSAYTLTDMDADVLDGKLINCYYDFASKDIVIPDTLDGQAVTGIENSTSFYGKGIEKIQLPSTLKYIGDYAFYDNAISSISMPDSAITIGSAVFNKNAITEINGKPSRGLFFAKNTDGTNDSTTIVSYGGTATVIDFIPSTVKTLGSYAFIDNSLTKVSIPGSVTSIGTAAFNWNTLTELNGSPTNGLIFNRKPDGTDDVTSIVSYCGANTVIDFIPGTVTCIGDYVFQYSAVTSVTIPATIESIGANAFADNSITQVTFEANGNLKQIGYSAFNNNPGFSITLPASGIPGFSGWIDERNKIHAAGSMVSTLSYYTANIPYTLTDADVVMQENHIKEITHTADATAITIPDTLDGQAVIGVRSGVFQDKGVALIYLPMHAGKIDFDGWLNFDGNATDTNDSGQYVTNRLDETYIAKLPSYTLTSFDVDIQNGYMQGSDFSFIIKHIIIPDTLDGQAIKGISKLQGNGIKSIKLPSTLEHIGSLAFCGNPISSITIPASVKTIGSSAFYGIYYVNTSLLTHVYFEAGSRLTSIGNSAFSQNPYLSYINYLPDSLVAIGDEAFKKCVLTNVSIPKSVVSVGKQAFSYNNLTNVSFENNSHIKVVGESAFTGNLNLTGITLPTSALDDFMGWESNLEDHIYNGGETTQNFTAEYKALYPYILTDKDVVVSDAYIQKYDVPDNQPHVIVFPDTLDGQALKGIVDKYPSGIFQDRLLLTIQLPPTLQYIGDWAFNDNHISSISIPESVIYIGSGAFFRNRFSSLILPDHNTPGFAGWIDEDGNYVAKNSNGNYVITDLFLSYTAAYTVLFNDHDGALLKRDSVKHGSSALPPPDPVRTGYTFTGWDIDFSKITRGITTTAQYSNNGTNNYSVEFRSFDGNILSSQTVSEGEDATPPQTPVRPGYTFSGWDGSYINITENRTLRALYSLDLPMAEFKADLVSGQAPFTVQFTDNSVGMETAAWLWDFGDGHTNASQNPEHSYTAAGTYSVSLTVTNASGSDTETKTDYIAVSATPLPIYTVTFVDWNNTVLKTQAVSEGNAASPPQDPVRTGYSFSGWNASCVNITSHRTITAGYSLNLPVVDFTANMVSGQAPFTVQFTDNSVGMETAAWFWDFGDGHTDASQNPEHNYSAAGTYTVSLTVTNASGSDIETKTDYIAVSATPLPTYTVTFVDWDNSVLKTQTVSSGNSVSPPHAPDRAGYISIGWFDSDNNKISDFSQVFADLLVTIQYRPLTSVHTIESDKLKIFPNPVKEVLTIEYPSGINLEELNVLNSAGVLLFRTDDVYSGMPVNMRDMASGLLMVQIKSEKGVWNYFVIK